MALSDNSAKPQSRRGRKSKKDRIIEGFGLSDNAGIASDVGLKTADDIAREVMGYNAHELLSAISRNTAKGLVGASRKASDSLELIQARIDDSAGANEILGGAFSEFDFNSANALLAENEMALSFTLGEVSRLVVIDGVLRRRIEEIRREKSCE